MTRNPSPLRYPGGKVCLSEVLRAILYENRLQGCTYIEPFAGGVGAGLWLLFNGHIDRLVINDFDPAIYAFWNTILRRNDEFVEKLLASEASLTEWRRQREIYRSRRNQTHLDLGFSAFYLNRCNRSGIIKNGGPIGGQSQKGKWNIDARYNKVALADRLKKIAEFRERITVTCEDGASLLGRLDSVVGAGEQAFLYADPPYYVKGRGLYFSSFGKEDHATFATAIRKTTVPWVLTYDAVPETVALFPDEQVMPFSLRYSANSDSLLGGEILVAPKTVKLPRVLDGELRKLGGLRGEQKAGKTT